MQSLGAARDRNEADHVLCSRRVALALESELTLRRWDVLTEFNTLLYARVDPRPMLWDSDALEDGFELMGPRPREAAGAIASNHWQGAEEAIPAYGL